jgi:hypothetical protein
MLGTLPTMRDGFVMTGAGDCAATDDVEFDRAGELGLALVMKGDIDGGDGAVRELVEFLC